MEQLDINFQAVKKWLDDNEVSYKENVQDKKFDVHIDIWIAKYRIAIRKSQPDDQEFYKIICKKYKPFFVRPDDTEEFSLEKIQNCLKERIAWLEKFQLRAKRRSEHMKRIKEKKRAEITANAVKIDPNQKFKKRRKRIQRVDGKPVKPNKPTFGPPKIGGFNLTK